LSFKAPANASAAWLAFAKFFTGSKALNSFLRVVKASFFSLVSLNCGLSGFCEASPPQAALAPLILAA
jgi:hypothetical protein